MQRRISIRGRVRPSVGPYVPCYFWRWKVRILGASCAVYPALFYFFIIVNLKKKEGALIRQNTVIMIALAVRKIQNVQNNKKYDDKKSHPAFLRHMIPYSWLCLVKTNMKWYENSLQLKTTSDERVARNFAIWFELTGMINGFLRWNGLSFHPAFCTSFTDVYFLGGEKKYQQQLKLKNITTKQQQQQQQQKWGEMDEPKTCLI